MRRMFITTALALVLAGAGQAEEVALVLGNDRYETLDRMPRATEVVDAAADLESQGFEVIALSDGRRASTADALAQYVAALPEAEKILVALSGRFVTDGTRTWLLTTDAAEPGLFTLGDRAVSVDSLLATMAGAPGRAILVLGIDPGGEEIDPWLHHGVGNLLPPQGVTVLQAGPRVAAGLISRAIAVPGTDLAAEIADLDNVLVGGFLPAGYAFLPEGWEPDIPLAPVEDDTAAREAELALWSGVVALDTAAAYRNYLDAYPRGEFADEAQEALAAILAEPNRDARLAEEALDLSREERREIQRKLTLISFGTRGVDGIFGPATRGAITYWQQENGFPQTGYLTAEQINRLDAQAARRAAQLEAEEERRAQVAAAAERAYWEETGARNDEAGFRAYLERYPDGIFAETAVAQLALIEDARRDSAGAADRADWDRARAEDTVAAYRAYLRSHPEGGYREEAEVRIRALRQAEEADGQNAEARETEAALGLNTATLRIVEGRLDQLQLDPGTVDGELDGDSRRAIRTYQRDRGLAVTGFLNEMTLVRLLADVVAAPID